jgi:hypothetical protein
LICRGSDKKSLLVLSHVLGASFQNIERYLVLYVSAFFTDWVRLWINGFICDAKTITEAEAIRHEAGQPI